MKSNYLNEPWEQIPISFKFPFCLIWFLSPAGYIDGYFLNYGSFRPVNGQSFKLRIPFILPIISTEYHTHIAAYELVQL